MEKADAAVLKHKGQGGVVATFAFFKAALGVGILEGRVALDVEKREGHTASEVISFSWREVTGDGRINLALRFLVHDALKGGQLGGRAVLV